MLPQFLAFVATDPRFAPFKTDEDVLNCYRAIESRVMARVPQFFGHLPRTRFEIRATEKFRAASASVEYNAGTADGSRPGIFYVPIVDPVKFRTPRMEDLFLHEAIPGHHFQLSLALENSGLPKFRRYDANNAYVEGWALYTERLSAEMGLLSGDLDRFGILSFDAWRACRLVVDTGLHALGWSRDAAIAFMVDHTALAENNIVNEVDRYLALPGQALAYKLGQLEILRLRDRARASDGPAFDIRAFHDVVLGQGALGLPTLRRVVEDWIATR
jgi:uncharacterized protein (DUF885 family)